MVNTQFTTQHTQPMGLRLRDRIKELCVCQSCPDALPLSPFFPTENFPLPRDGTGESGVVGGERHEDVALSESPPFGFVVDGHTYTMHTDGQRLQRHDNQFIKNLSKSLSVYAASGTQW